MYSDAAAVGAARNMAAVPRRREASFSIFGKLVCETGNEWWFLMDALLRADEGNDERAGGGLMLWILYSV